MTRNAGASTLELLEGARAYNRWTFDRIRKHLGGRVLEIGCGTGTITAFLLDRELVVGIDVDEAYVRFTRARFRGHPNVVIQKQDLTESIAGLSEYGFDSAVSVNVFEHIQDDETAMRAVFALLRPGGTLTLMVPGHPVLLGGFDRAIGHHRRYTKPELRRKLEASGFTVEAIRRTNPVGALGWLLLIRVLGFRELRGVGLNERLVPLLSALDVVEPPFGLSLVAVGRKPAEETYRRPAESRPEAA